MADPHRYWAIRRKADGKLRPVTRYPRSNTSVEFDDYGEPRLYLTRSAALNSLSWWLSGIAKLELEWESTDEYGSGYYVTGLPTPGNCRDKAGNFRRRDEYEVVEVSLVFWEPAA